MEISLMISDGTVTEILSKRKDQLTADVATVGFRVALRDALLPTTGKNVPLQVDYQMAYFCSQCDASVLVDEFNDAAAKLKEFGIKALWKVSLAALNSVLIRAQEAVLVFHHDWNPELREMANKYGFFPDRQAAAQA
jgi:hypothetical protein